MFSEKLNEEQNYVVLNCSLFFFLLIVLSSRTEKKDITRKALTD